MYRQPCFVTSLTLVSSVHKPARYVSYGEQANCSRLGYHWLDVGMRYGVKFHEIEFIVWSDVDVGALILSRVAVFRSGED